MADVLISRGEVLNNWELAAHEITTALTRSLSVALLGPASSGKDAAIRALFGVDFGQIDPIPGSTERIRVIALDGRGKFLVINAPGFGDLREEVEREARKVLDMLDVAIYLINCDGGATIDERRDLDHLKSLGRPFLVCFNKIDLIRPHQRQDFIETTRQQLGLSQEQVVITAFDPLPALAKGPLGVDQVIAWLYRQLETDGKALLFAKYLRNKASAAQAIIETAARRAAIAGAIPVPGADMTAVTAIQVKLIGDLAEVYDQKLGQDVALFILGEILAGSSKGFIRWGLEALKSAGWIPGGQIAHLATSALGASIASATTYGIGRATVAFLQGNRQMTGEELRTVFDREAFQWKEK